MTQKPIKATLDNTSDECKTQKPILVQLEDIPQPTDADAGKVLGVDSDGKYELTEGASKIYQHTIRLQEYSQTVDLVIISNRESEYDKPALITFLKNSNNTVNKLYPVGSNTAYNYIADTKTYIVQKLSGIYYYISGGGTESVRGKNNRLLITVDENGSITNITTDENEKSFGSSTTISDTVIAL